MPAVTSGPAVGAATEPDDMFAIDRQLGWLISLCGPLLMLGTTVPVLSGVADFAPWWNVVGAVLVTMTLAGAALGRALPARLLRAWWVAAPLLGMMLFGTTFLAYRGSDPDAVMPWVWTFEAVLVTYQVLWLPMWAAAMGAVVSGLLPALSGLLVLGSLPTAIAVQTPIHVSDVVFIALFAGIRGRLRRLKATERHAEELDESRVRAAADVRRRRRLAAVVHDEVLATLTAANAFTGRPPASLQAQASHALSILELAPFTETGTPDLPVDAATARDRLTGDLREIDPDCAIDLRADAGMLPAPVADAVVAAAAEALRNSIRHAGPGAARAVRGRLSPQLVQVEIADDGRGFDLATIGPARLGVRSSIIQRMRSVPGGNARIDTRPGHGARVELSWRI